MQTFLPSLCHFSSRCNGVLHHTGRQRHVPCKDRRRSPRQESEECELRGRSGATARTIAFSTGLAPDQQGIKDSGGVVVVVVVHLVSSHTPKPAGAEASHWSWKRGRRTRKRRCAIPKATGEWPSIIKQAGATIVTLAPAQVSRY